MPVATDAHKPWAPAPAARGLGGLIARWGWVGLPIVAVGGWFDPRLGLAVPFCFVGAIVFAAFAGRQWCGTVCPRGTFSDQVLARFSRHQMPAWAQSWGVRWTVLAVMMGLMVTQLTVVWGDWIAVGRVFVTLLTVTTVLAVIVGALTHQRVWCAVCPAGTMANLVGRGRGAEPALAGGTCRDCGLCARPCPMALEPHKLNEAAAPCQGDCLKCGRCAVACPSGALSMMGNDQAKEVQEVEA